MIANTLLLNLGWIILLHLGLKSCYIWVDAFVTFRVMRLLHLGLIFVTFRVDFCYIFLGWLLHLALLHLAVIQAAHNSNMPNLILSDVALLTHEIMRKATFESGLRHHG